MSVPSHQGPLSLPPFCTRAFVFGSRFIFSLVFWLSLRDDLAPPSKGLLQTLFDWNAMLKAAWFSLWDLLHGAPQAHLQPEPLPCTNSACYHGTVVLLVYACPWVFFLFHNEGPVFFWGELPTCLKERWAVFCFLSPEEVFLFITTLGVASLTPPAAPYLTCRRCVFVSFSLFVLLSVVVGCFFFAELPRFVEIQTPPLAPPSFPMLALVALGFLKHLDVVRGASWLQCVDPNFPPSPAPSPKLNPLDREPPPKAG